MTSNARPAATQALWAAVGGAVVGAAVVAAVWGIRSGARSSAKDTRPAAATTVATVGGKTITLSAMQTALMTQFGAQKLQQMIDDTIVNEAARASHLSATAADISAAQAGVEAQYGIQNSSQMALFLQQNGLTPTQFKAVLREQVLEQKLAQSAVTVNSRQIQAYYRSHLSAFTATGAKSATPLGQVRGQVVADLKVANARTIPQEIALLSKRYDLRIVYPAFRTLQTTIEGG